MKKWFIVVGGGTAVLAILLLFYHRPLSIITPSRGISSARSKVVLISFDGGSNQLLHQFKSSFPMDNGFRKVEKDGFLADEGLEVSSPSLTAPSHISLATGVAPSFHGIVSNQFHIPGDSIDQSVNGFTYEIDPGAETIWEEAKRNGKKVGGIAYPALDRLSPKREADWGVSYTKQESPGFLFKKSRTDFIPYPEKLPDKIKSYTPPLYTPFSLTGTLSEGRYTDDSFNDPYHDRETKPSPRESRSAEVSKHAFQMIAVDLTDDKKENYDALLIDDDFNLQNDFQGTADLKKSPWIGIQFSSGDIVKGSWCKLLSLSPDLSDMQFYIGAVHSTQAYPAYYLKGLTEKIGFWPGAPDRGNLGKGVTPEMIVEQSLRLADYLFKATLLAVQNPHETPWDLILTYQPMLDELEHQFLLTDPSQKDFSKEKSDEYLGYIKRGYLKANDMVNALIKETETSSANIYIIVVSDHGMAPLRKIYYPNRLLRERGFIQTDNDDPLRIRKDARAFSSGGMSHLYVNLKDREKDGTVPKERKERNAQPPYDIVRDKLVEIFKEEASKENSPIQQVLKREEATAIGLNHPHSGDVVIIGNPGFHFTDAMTPGAILEDASFYGQHGYDPTLPVMKGIFAVYGPNLRKDFIKEPVSYKDVKPLVLKLLQ